MKPIIIVLALLLLTAVPAVAQDITLSNESPEVGEAITVTLDEAVDTLRVVYRPNSSVARTEFVTSATPTSTFTWSAASAGLVQLSYAGRGAEAAPVSRNVSVRFAGLSVPGLAIMLLAGGILFGGVVLAFRTLFRDEEEDGTLDLEPEELPDT